MGLLTLIKRLLDLGTTSDRRTAERGTKVPVERESTTDPVSDTESEAAPLSQETKAESGDDAESVDMIKGIGPSYSERLAEHDITTVEDLAGADAESLASETGIGVNRLTSWIERAKIR